MPRNAFFGTPELRKKLKAYYRQLRQIWKIHAALLNYGESAGLYVGSIQPLSGGPLLPAFPEECKGMLCGAKTRSGRPCRNDGTLFANGRCKLHGGLSTGPKSAEGKRKSAQNGWSPKRTP